MTDVFVVFGSASDKAVYEPLLEKFKRAGISSEFKILSAHKTPKEVKYALSNTNAEIIVAGAGLSAALPGVIAAETIKPVIGLPCDGAFQGIDSFLSVCQMPPDVPVIAVGIGKTSETVTMASHFLHGFNEIVLVKKTTGEEKQYFDRCKAFMQENRIPFTIENNSKKQDHSKIFIEFTKFGKKPLKNRNTVITVLVKDNSVKKDSIKFFDSLQNSYSVGLNNYKNAAVVALELINRNHEFDGVLVDLRKKAAEKVMNANK